MVIRNVLRSKYITCLLLGSIALSATPMEAFSFLDLFSKKRTNNSFFQKRGSLGRSLLGLIATTAVIFCAWGLYKYFNRVTPVNRLKTDQELDKAKKTGIDLGIQGSESLSFDQFKAACDKLPKYSQVKKDQKYKATALTKEQFLGAINDLFDVMSRSTFADKSNWIGSGGPLEDAFKYEEDSKKTFVDDLNHNDNYFVQKLLLPENAQVSMHADIHGDIHSVIAYINDLVQKGYVDNNFKIIKPNFYIAFLGDYTDRGYYGAEVLYAVARLKTANPEQVILGRGNHENLGMNSRFGFLGIEKDWFNFEPGELEIKYGLNSLKGEYINRLLTRLYNFMPVAVFVGCTPKDENDYKDYAILFHGGIEPRFNPNPLLVDNRNILYQKIDNLDLSWVSESLREKINKDFGADLKHKINSIEAFDVGFLWNDFNVDKNLNGYRDRGRGFVFSHELVQDYLENCSSKENKYRVRSIFRGHQHNGDMLNNMVENNGLYNIWAEKQNQWNVKDSYLLDLKNTMPVWVMNVSPDNTYGLREGYSYDTYAILKLAGQYDNWTLAPCNVEVLNR